MKIRPVGAELFHTDGQTDMTKLTDVYRNFANAPKSERIGNHNIYFEAVTSVIHNVIHGHGF